MTLFTHVHDIIDYQILIDDDNNHEVLFLLEHKDKMNLLSQQWLDENRTVTLRNKHILTNKIVSADCRIIASFMKRPL